MKWMNYVLLVMIVILCLLGIYFGTHMVNLLIALAYSPDVKDLAPIRLLVDGVLCIACFDVARRLHYYRIARY